MHLYYGEISAFFFFWALEIFFVINNNILNFFFFKLLLGTAVGDPLGGCRVTPYGYSVMLKKVSIQFVHILH